MMDIESPAHIGTKGNPCQTFRISNAKRAGGRGPLDPITVVVFDFKNSTGQIIVECFGAAWAAFYGNYGSAATLLDFLAATPPESLADRMVVGANSSGRRLTSIGRRRESEYVLDIASAVTCAARNLTNAAGAGRG